VIVAFIAISVLSLLVALLKAMTLALCMQAFAVLQGLAMVGVEGAKESPYYTAQLSTVAVYLYATI
jgi:hypothetical protein